MTFSSKRNKYSTGFLVLAAMMVATVSAAQVVLKPAVPSAADS